MATLAYAGSEFKVTHLEMIKVSMGQRHTDKQNMIEYKNTYASRKYWTNAKNFITHKFIHPQLHMLMHKLSFILIVHYDPDKLRHQTLIHDSCSWVYYFVSLFGIIWKLKYLLQGIKCASEDRQMRYDEEVVVPIIDNTPFEADLADSMAQVRWYCIQVYIYILFMYLFTYLLLSIYFPVYIPIWYYKLAIWKMERLGHIS